LVCFNYVIIVGNKLSNLINLINLFNFCYNYDSKNLVPGVRVLIHEAGLSKCEFLYNLEDRNKIHFKNIMVLL